MDWSWNKKATRSPDTHRRPQNHRHWNVTLGCTCQTSLLSLRRSHRRVPTAPGMARLALPSYSPRMANQCLASTQQRSTPSDQPLTCLDGPHYPPRQSRTFRLRRYRSCCRRRLGPAVDTPYPQRQSLPGARRPLRARDSVEGDRFLYTAGRTS